MKSSDPGVLLPLFSSFRTQIEQAVTPFAELLVPSVPSLKGLLVEIVVGVSSSREEGFRIAPAVYLCRELSELLSAVRGTLPIALGEGGLDEISARVALKSCLSLGEGRQWAIYFVVHEHGLSYGVFCTDRLPLGTTSFENLRSPEGAGRAIVGVTRLGDSLVELRGGGCFKYLDFSAAPGLDVIPTRLVKDFAGTVTRDVPKELRQQFETFFYRLGVEVLSANHGTILAVLDHRQAAIEYLGDGIWLESPIRIDGLIRTYEATRSDRDTLSLVALSSLIRRMAALDGITVFGSDGSLRGYNCFIREGSAASPPRDMIGGARRRAYEILCNHLDGALLAALYRSQDGATEFRISR
jgi:hypothetical protein